MTSRSMTERPFFSPRSVLSSNTIDYRSLLVMIGARLPDAFTEAAMGLISDTRMIYNMPSMTDIAALSENEIPRSQVKLETIEVANLSRFEFVTVELEGGYRGFPELAFAIRTRNDTLIYLKETDMVRIFSGKYLSEWDTPITVGDMLNNLSERLLLEYLRVGTLPCKLSPDVAREMNPLTGPNRIPMSLASGLAVRIADFNNLPYLHGGRLIQPSDRKVKIPDIPELSTFDLDEARKLNPHFGALAF